MLAGRRKQKLDELAQLIRTEFPSAPAPEVLQVDVSDMEQVKSIQSRMVNRDIDILVNNAGLSLGIDGADQNDIDDAQTVVNTNLMSVIALSR